MRVLFLSLLLLGCAHQPPADQTVSIAGEKTTTHGRVHRFVLSGAPLMGVSDTGQEIYLGGFSGLKFLGKTDSGKLRFLSLSDRGPNAAEQESEGRTIRPFVLPAFQPRIIFLQADPATSTFSVEKMIPLVRPDGKALSGLPSRAGLESAVDLKGKNLPLDPYGMDPEGIALAADGSFWVGEEYGPSLAHFSPEGKLLEVLKPGQGLPKVFEQIRLNRGFEGVTLGGGKLYGMLQSPLDNPRSEKQKSSKKSRLVRIVEVDPREGKTIAQYGYLQGPGKSDKMGDIAYEAPGQFLAIEQNGNVGKKSVKKIYRFRIGKATNLQLLTEKVAGPGGALEGMDKKALAAAEVALAEKEEVADLASLGVVESKAEGIDFVEPGMVAVIVDNDFGLEGEWDQAAGKVALKEEKSALYLIKLPE